MCIYLIPHFRINHYLRSQEFGSLKNWKPVLGRGIGMFCEAFDGKLAIRRINQEIFLYRKIKTNLTEF